MATDGEGTSGYLINLGCLKEVLFFSDLQTIWVNLWNLGNWSLNKAMKLKFKSNEKKFLFIAEIKDYSSLALDTIKKGDFLLAPKSVETSLNLIQRQHKLRSNTGWLVVQEYKQEALADNSEDEERI